ncbi:MAG TPA: PDZ domain-containing protein [Microthrixaceae bacterium]|nr:PDZ domain-containing protein [Microthrixaceae bacterium]HMT60387.1 PDZ domain-containing protein [Microthrixaceae bacterium]
MSVSAVDVVAADGRPARRRRRFVLWGVCGVLVVALAAAFIVPLPYYVDAPGQVTGTEPRISVSGRQSFATPGRVMFTTVSQQQATAALLVRSWLDDTIDTIPDEVAVPSGNRTKERVFEQRMMDQSKETAVRVALDRLGIDYEASGGGAFIAAFLPGFEAEHRLFQGDVIVAVDGTEVHTVDDVANAMKGRAVGSVAVLTVRHRADGSTDDVEIPLGRNRDDESRGYLGVALETANPSFDFPFKVELDSGNVIGPSAGLAWTLGIVDRLTPGDLTDGRRVAVTGTIDSAGNVGPIGGIAQKAEGAKQAGATVFLYPAATPKAEVARVRRIANGDLDLHAVATVDDALEVLGFDGAGQR